MGLLRDERLCQDGADSGEDGAGPGAKDEGFVAPTAAARRVAVGSALEADGRLVGRAAPGVGEEREASGRAIPPEYLTLGLERCTCLVFSGGKPSLMESALLIKFAIESNSDLN